MPLIGLTGTYFAGLLLSLTVAYYFLQRELLEKRTTEPSLPEIQNLVEMAGIAPLKAIVLPAISKHTATIIFAHGLGDSGHGWEPVADMFRSDPQMAHIKWILPHAPSQPVTINMGMRMPSWFDIADLGFKAVEDEKGMLQTVHSLNQLISAEVDAGIPASRILLGGFSQGGAMALLAGLSTERRLAGLAVMSGWVPLREKFASMVSDHAKSVPIFWGHGTVDPMVRFEYGKASSEFLKSKIGIPEATKGASGPPKGLDFNAYVGVPHSTNAQELDDLHAWLKRLLPAADAE